MGNRVERTRSGFAVLDPRIVLANLAPNDGAVTGSSYSQAGARPGSAVPGDSRGSMLPHAHNGQDADLDLRVQRAGEPALDGAGIIYRENGETDTKYRGWNEPNVVLGYHPVAFTSTEDWGQVAAITIPSSQKVVVVGADQDSTARVVPSSWTWSPQSRTWGSRVTVNGSGANAHLVAAVLFEDTERVVAYSAAAGTTSRPDAFYSDDAGATWAAYSGDFLGGTNFNAAVDRIVAITDRHGNVFLLAVDEATGDRWIFRSTNRGMTFTSVSNTTAWGKSPHLSKLANGDILVTYLAAATNRPSYFILEDAYDTIGTGTEITTTAADLQVTWVDADGTVYCAWRESANQNRVRLHRSIDSSTTWAEYDFGLVARSATTDRWEPRACTSSGGESIFLLNTDQAPAEGSEGSLTAIVLGGWANLEQTLNATTQGGRTGRVSGGYNASSSWQRVFLPTALLANDGWTALGTAETLVNGYHRFNSTGATSHATLSLTHQDGIATLLGEFQVVSGGNTAAKESGIAIRRANGAYDYRVELWMGTTGFQVRDATGGGATIGSVSIDMTTLLQIVVNIKANFDVEVFYKRVGDTLWTAGPTGTLANGGATGSTTDLIDVGNIGITTTDLRVGLLTWMRGMDRRGTTDDSIDLEWGKALTSRPYPVRDQGPATAILHLSADGGPARIGEAFDLNVIYDHGIDRLFPTVAPSRAQYWQAASTAEQIITFDLGADTSLDGSWCWVLGMFDTNFRTAHFERRLQSGEGGWVSLGTWDAAIGTSLSFARAANSNVIRPLSGTAAALRYIQSGELAVGRQGFVILDPTGTPKARRVAWNSGGVWRNSTTQWPTLRLEGIDGTEPAPSGTCHVIAGGGVLIVPQALDTHTRYLRVRIPNQTTVGGEAPRIGSLFLGAVCIAGRQWSRGWSVRYEQSERVEEDDYGTLYVDDRGPHRRELTVAWQDGFDITAIRSGGDLDYLSPSVSTAALAADQDVWFNLAGILQLGRGGAVPSIALMSIPTTTTMVTDPTQFIFGPLRGRLQVNHVQGDEGVSEVVRVESLTLREQPPGRSAA